MDIQRFTQLWYQSCTQEISGKKYDQNKVDFMYFWLDINKTKVEICQEVLRDVSQNFESAGEFIKKKKRIQEIRDRKKISAFMYVKICMFTACY